MLPKWLFQGQWFQSGSFTKFPHTTFNKFLAPGARFQTFFLNFYFRKVLDNFLLQPTHNPHTPGKLTTDKDVTEKAVTSLNHKTLAKHHQSTTQKTFWSWKDTQALDNGETNSSSFHGPTYGSNAQRILFFDFSLLCFHENYVVCGFSLSTSNSPVLHRIYFSDTERHRNVISGCWALVHVPGMIKYWRSKPWCSTSTGPGSVPTTSSSIS